MPDDPNDPSQLWEAALAQAVAFRRSLPAGLPPAQPYRTILDAFAAPLPEHGEAGTEVIARLAAGAVPGLRAPAGGRFFGWVMGGSHPVGVAADWLTSAWGQNAGNHVAAPAASAVEAIAARWLLDLLDLPRASSVGFVTGGTMANFVALAAARGAVLRAAHWDVERDGLFGAPPVTVLAGAEAHVTVRSALQYLGLGHGRVTVLEADSEGRIVPAAFAKAIAAAAGPTIVVLQAGQVNTGAFDLFAELIPIAKAKGAWVHVDGAFGLFARAESGLRPLTDGMEGADSWSTDGHKWLQIPFDSGFVFVRDTEAHHRAMIISESYLPAAGADDRDPGNTVPELSRRARGFAVWAMLQHLGRSGVAALVREHCRLARHFAARLAAEPGIAVINDVVLNQVLVRFGADEPDERGDALTRETIAAIQVDGTAFAGGGSWRGRWVMRLSVISWATTEADIDRSADAMIAAWRKVRDH